MGFAGQRGGPRVECGHPGGGGGGGGGARLTTPRRSFFYRLQKYAFRKFPSFIPDPERLEILTASRKWDEEKNTSTEPPPDELIDLRCIWAVELYAPEQAGQLLSWFEKLGWNTVDTLITGHSPTRWIQRLRETAYGGGWFNLGPIHRPGDRRFLHAGRSAQLPPEVDYALASMYSLTSSLTCIVIGFVLDKTYSARLDESIRRKRETVIEPLTRGGYHLLGPDFQKTTDIRTIRAAMRESATNWFRTNLPGIFAGGLLENEFPTCEFLTLRSIQPFPTSGEVEGKDKDWLRLLNVDTDIDAWEADSLRSLKFDWLLSRDEKSRFHAVVAAKEDAFPEEKLRTYGGGDRASYVVYVDDIMNGLLSRWALLCMLLGFERHLNNIRDSAKFKPTKKEDPLHLLRELSGHVSQSVDIAIASAELRHFAEQKASFEHDLETFKPSDTRFYRDKDITLNQVLQKQIHERSEWLKNLDRSVRDRLVQYGTILGTRENIKLQNHMSKLTWVILVLTLLMTALTVLTVYIAAKAGGIHFPW